MKGPIAFKEKHFSCEVKMQLVNLYGKKLEDCGCEYPIVIMFPCHHRHVTSLQISSSDNVDQCTVVIPGWGFPNAVTSQHKTQETNILKRR